MKTPFDPTTVNLKNLVSITDWVNYNGVLMHPNDPRIPKTKPVSTPRPKTEIQVLTAEDMEKVREANRRSAEFMAKGGVKQYQKNEGAPAINDNMKTYGIAALTFGLIVFIGKKIKSATPKKVKL